MDGILPSFLKYKSAVDLVRVGKDCDGGYLISKQDIEASDTLIGLGISEDWSFEADFYSYKNVPVIAYDASVNKKYFLKRIIKSLPRLDKPKMLPNSIKRYLSYTDFFKNNRKHIEKFVGLNFGDSCGIDSVFKETDSSKLFLKIDIEGSEYRILDDLINNKNRITGLVIEFHDCDLHIDRIQSFVERFKIPLVHIHANNFAPTTEDTGLPLVLEMTFSKNAKLGADSILPHKFDTPNNRDDSEITLKFSDAKDE